MTQERSTHYLADAIRNLQDAEHRLRHLNMGGGDPDFVLSALLSLERAVHNVRAWDALRRSVNPATGTALTSGFCTSDGAGTAGCV